MSSSNIKMTSSRARNQGRFLRVLFFILPVCFGVLLSGCLEMGERYSAIPPGIWRAELQVATHPEDYADERSKGLLPFNFEVHYTTPDSFYLVILNGKERLENRYVSWGHNIRDGSDTLRIEFPVYGTYIAASFEEDFIEGYWYVPFRGEDYRIPFRAWHGRSERFEGIPDSSVADLTGKWKVTFSVEKDLQSYAVGEFMQDGHVLRGTFVKTTGDYRFLDGKVDGNRMFLSTFDGTHAYLFEAKILDDGSLSGVYRSGKHYKTYWTAVRDADFTLPSADSLVQQRSEAGPVTFQLKDLEGNVVSPQDPEFEGKPMLIQVMGTWCPNCRDETEFLSGHLSTGQKDSLGLIAIAFERSGDYYKALPALRKFQQQFNVDYPVLFGGSLNKADAHAVFPQLDTILAYPTMLFLDRDKHIKAVHTGFNGPATSGFAAFQTSFSQQIEHLIHGKEEE